MSQNQLHSQEAFERELGALIDRFIDNWDLSITSAIGTLEKVKLDLYMSNTIVDEEEEDEGGD